MEEFPHLIYDKSDARFSNDLLSYFNRKIIQHSKRCDMAREIGVCYGIWADPRHGIMKYVECYCG